MVIAVEAFSYVFFHFQVGDFVVLGCFSIYVWNGTEQAFLGNGCKTGMKILCCEFGSLVLETRRVYLSMKRDPTA